MGENQEKTPSNNSVTEAVPGYTLSRATHASKVNFRMLHLRSPAIVTLCSVWPPMWPRLIRPRAELRTEFAENAMRTENKTTGLVSSIVLALFVCTVRSTLSAAPEEERTMPQLRTEREATHTMFPNSRQIYSGSADSSGASHHNIAASTLATLCMRTMYSSVCVCRN